MTILATGVTGKIAQYLIPSLAAGEASASEAGMFIQTGHALGLALIGGVFLWAGIEHFVKFRAISGDLAARRFPAPAFLLAAGSMLEVVAGFCLAMGVAVPYTAGALILFTAAANMLVLCFWRYGGPERQALRSAFLINVAVIGGLVLAATIG
ncbi:DoxX family protein [Mesorhizobium sp.]|uniref:DoxX family protein n=1 Tax=Mesorhizobium sp. TaxID=1871066 RepID=UPI0025F428ED|nr:DoxX family protein [Mesorhizobium sp.]